MPPLSSITEVQVNQSTPHQRRRRAAAAAVASPRTSGGGDRHVPSRARMDLAISSFELEKATNPDGLDCAEMNASPAKEEYKRLLAKSLFRGKALGNRVLSFDSGSGDGGAATDARIAGGKAATSSTSSESCALATPASIMAKPSSAAANSSSDNATLRMLYERNRHELGRASWRGGRYIPNAPERILDAPDLIDDYYLNLLDWNAQNILAVALGDSVYLWNATTGSITLLMQTGGNGCHVTSIAWAPQGVDLMAIGTSDHRVQLWDTAKCCLVRSMAGHCGRVGTLAWGGGGGGGGTLCSGSRDATIMQRDMRLPGSAATVVLNGHTQEVCGLKWAPSGTMLASGGNDNLLNVWDERRLPTSSPAPLYSMEQHKAAVKALAWCPWQKHVLASGGGTADRMIRFWSMNDGRMINAVDTHSQVCALVWSVHDHELVSSHGFSHNQLILWKYPSMVKAAELTGHTARVLHMAQSPDGSTVVSAAADETLRFWKILGSDAAARRGRAESVLSPSPWTGASVVR